jgi:peptidoglycan/LPS O-acetylase OafA/YrhL
MLSPAAMNYRSYGARRIIRLWIPYAVTLILAALSIRLIGSHRIARQSEWMNSFLGTTLSPQMLAQHALMIGSFDTRPLDFVIWSLVLEMRISLMFPALYWAVERYPPGLTLAVSVMVGAIGLFLEHHSDSSNISIAATLVCQTYFVIGALLSRFQSQIGQRYALIAPPAGVLLFAASLVLYCNCLRISATYSTMLGATWLVIVALCSPRAQAFLNRPLIQWLGKVSYSLYLCHVVVILALINLLYPRLAFSWIVLMCIPTIFAVSFGLNRFIEQPAIALSRAAGRRLQARERVLPVPV